MKRFHKAVPTEEKRRDVEIKSHKRTEKQRETDGAKACHCEWLNFFLIERRRTHGLQREKASPVFYSCLFIGGRKGGIQN